MSVPPFTLRAVCCVITVHPAFVQPLIWRLHCGAHVPDPRSEGQSLPDPGPARPPTPFSFHTGVQKCADLQSPERDTISRLTASVRRNRGNPSTMAWTSIRHSKNPQPCAARKTQPLSFAAIVTAGYCDSCFLEGTLCQRCEWHKCYELEMLLNKWM